MPPISNDPPRGQDTAGRIIASADGCCRSEFGASQPRLQLPATPGTIAAARVEIVRNELHRCDGRLYLGFDSEARLRWESICINTQEQLDRAVDQLVVQGEARIETERFGMVLVALGEAVP